MLEAHRYVLGRRMRLWVKVRSVGRTPEEPDVHERFQDQFRIPVVQVPACFSLIKRDSQIRRLVELPTDNLQPIFDPSIERHSQSPYCEG